MKTILIVLGLLGIAFGVLSYRQSRHMPRNKKKSIIIVAISILILLLGIFISSNKIDGSREKAKESLSQEKSFTLTDREEKMMMKKYEDFTGAEKRRFTELEKEFDKLGPKEQEEYIDGFLRIKEERARLENK